MIDHEYDDKWSYNDLYHWHKTKCSSHSEVVISKEKHIMNNGKCTKCDYVEKEANNKTYIEYFYSLINEYADPELYTTRFCRDYIIGSINITDYELDYFREIAEEATFGIQNDLNKIKKIYELVASNIYYDQWRIDNGYDEVEGNVYEHWIAKRGVCEEFATFCNVFLNSIGIPTFKVGSLGAHVYNFSYDRNSLKWICYDSTHGGGSTYTPGREFIDGSINYDYFNMSIEEVASYGFLFAPESFELRTNETIYVINTNNLINNSWPKTGNWTAYIVGPIDSNKESIFLSSHSPFKDIEIVGIQGNAFLNNQTIKKVVIEYGIKEIGQCAFAFCNNLTNIYLPNSITTIRGNAFEETKISEIRIPPSVKEIEMGVFLRCNELENINMLGSISILDANCFAECTKISVIDFSRSSILKLFACFGNCSALEKVVLPYNLSEIGNSSFNGCGSLKELVLYNNVNHINDHAFYGCFNLERITFIGTIAEWNDIVLDAEWNVCSAIKYIDCVDGILEL